MPTTIYITRSDINGLIGEMISPEEFITLVEDDPSLVWAEASGLVSDDRLAYITPRTSAIWKDVTTPELLWFVLDDDGTMAFGYREGLTGDQYLDKIFEVARKLHASVQRDDGEILLDSRSEG